MWVWFWAGDSERPGACSCEQWCLGEGRVHFHTYVLKEGEKRKRRAHFLGAFMCFFFCVCVCVWERECVCQLMGMFVFIHATAEVPSQGKERHSGSFPVWGSGARSFFASLTRDVWNVRLKQITTGDLPQGLVGLPVSWETLCSERACQAEMTASFCSGDFLSCPGLRVG